MTKTTRLIIGIPLCFTVLVLWFAWSAFRTAPPLAAETLRSEIDENQLPSIRNAAWSTILPALSGSVAEHLQQTSPEIMAARSAAEQSIASKSSTLKAGRDLGMVVQPSQVNPSLANKVVEGAAGGKHRCVFEHPFQDNVVK